MTVGNIYVVCLAYGLMNLFNICILIILANLHDIHDAKLGRIAKKDIVEPCTAPHTSFSIIVPAHNEEKVISRCIDSLTALDYMDYEVVIINDGSTDSTDTVIRKKILSLEHRTLAHEKSISFSYVDVRKNSGKASVLNTALRFAKGDIIVCMDADATFKSDALSRASVYFSDPTTAVVAVNNKLVAGRGLLHTLQRFDFIANYRSKKAYDVLNAEYIVSGIGAMYRRESLVKIGGIPRDTMTEDIDTSLLISLLGNTVNRIRYAEDIVTYMEPVHHFSDLLKQRYRWKFGNMQAMYKNRSKLFQTNAGISRSLRLWRFPMAVWSEFSMLIELAFMGFMIYISVFKGNGLFLLASYIIATGLCAATIIGDETETKQEKMELLKYIPLMYLLSLVMNVVQFYASTRSLLSSKQLWRPEGNYAWKSPVRHGVSLAK